MSTPEDTMSTPTNEAKRWAETRHRRYDAAHVAMAVVARGLRTEGVAAVCAGSAEQSELLEQTADAGLLEYIGHGDYVLTEDGANILSPGELARLRTWVRARLEALHKEAGHPVVGNTWRNWAAMRVGQELFDDGTTGPADALCEAAGWPS